MSRYLSTLIRYQTIRPCQPVNCRVVSVNFCTWIVTLVFHTTGLKNGANQCGCGHEVYQVHASVYHGHICGKFRFMLEYAYQFFVAFKSAIDLRWH